jgi:hypothetical protein
MRYLLVVVLLAAQAATLSAQRNTFSWGFDLFPHYGHRRLAVDESYTQIQIDSLEAAERYRPGIGAGLFVSWRAQKVGFQTGLSYLNTGYRSPQTPFQPTDPNSINFTDFRQVFRSQQIEIPACVYFYQELTPKDEFFFMFGTGLSYNFSNEDVLVRYNGETTDPVESDPAFSFRAVNIAFQTAMGWERHLGERMTLSVQPTFRFWLSGLYPSDTSINRNLYQLGFRIGFRFDRPI